MPAGPHETDLKWSYGERMTIIRACLAHMVNELKSLRLQILPLLRLLIAGHSVSARMTGTHLGTKPQPTENKARW